MNATLRIVHRRFANDVPINSQIAEAVEFLRFDVEDLG